VHTPAGRPYEGTHRAPESDSTDSHRPGGRRPAGTARGATRAPVAAATIVAADAGAAAESPGDAGTTAHVARHIWGQLRAWHRGARPEALTDRQDDSIRVDWDATCLIHRAGPEHVFAGVDYLWRALAECHRTFGTTIRGARVVTAESVLRADQFAADDRRCLPADVQVDHGDGNGNGAALIRTRDRIRDAAGTLIVVGDAIDTVAAGRFLEELPSPPERPVRPSLRSVGLRALEHSPQPTRSRPHPTHARPRHPRLRRSGT